MSDLRVVAAAWTMGRRGPVLVYLKQALDAGGQAILLVNGREGWDPVPAGILVIDVAADEHVLGVNRFASAGRRRLVLSGAAGVVAGTVVARSVGGSLADRMVTAGLAGSTVLSAALWLERAPQLGVGPLWARWVSLPPYKVLRWWLLRRATEHHLDVIDPESVTDVIIVGTESWPVARWVARFNPNVRVSFSLDEQALAHSRSQSAR